MSGRGCVAGSRTTRRDAACIAGSPTPRASGAPGGREPSDLYRGARLAAALEWRATHEDRLNHVEREFLDDSHAAALRQAHRRRRIFAGATALLALLAAVSTAFAIRGIERGRREQRADVSRALATQARAHLDDNVALAGLLGLEAFRIEPTAEARSAALSVLPALTSYHRLGAPLHHGRAVGRGVQPGRRDARDRRRRWRTVLGSGDAPAAQPAAVRGTPEPEVLDVAFSHDGRLLASGGADGTARLWNVARRAPASRPLSMHVDVVNGVAFSPDDRTRRGGRGRLGGRVLTRSARHRAAVERPVGNAAGSADQARCAYDHGRRVQPAWRAAGARRR